MRHRPLILGILNVTPDSFSDGGAFLDCDRARAHAERLWREGADFIDIGGESTRPGARPIGAQEELDRVLPVLEAIARDLPVGISIDTQKMEVAREAARRGARIVNDVNGGRNLVASELPPGLTYILMHRRGGPADMQSLTDYPAGVVTEVAAFLAEQVRAFTAQGVPREQIWIDPGIGFAKRAEQSLELLRRLDELVPLGGRLVVGTSRKSFLSQVASPLPIGPADREAGTLATSLWAYSRGASVFRVHCVGELRRALATWEAIENAG
jgi:dihydropteroate synthase